MRVCGYCGATVRASVDGHGDAHESGHLEGCILAPGYAAGETAEREEPVEQRGFGSRDPS